MDDLLPQHDKLNFIIQLTIPRQDGMWGHGIGRGRVSHDFPLILHII